MENEEEIITIKGEDWRMTMIDYNKLSAEEFAKEYCRSVDELFIKNLENSHDEINIKNLLQSCIDTTSRGYGLKVNE